MNRRDFLAAAAGAAALPIYGAPSKRPFVRGARLEPPQNELIPVALAISKNTTWIDFVGPMTVFETWHFDPVLKRHAPRFKNYRVSETLEPRQGLVPDFTFDTAPAPRVVVVPAQIGSDALLQWLSNVSKTADVTMSVCTGARHLAEAGLLNGKSATTHHEAVDDFAKKYPGVNWVRGVRFVEEERISTAGGLTCGIDLALRVVSRYFGQQDARAVADHLEHQGTGWIV